MSDRTFVDTNVWVYAVDDADPAKQTRARAILAPTASTDVVLSVQVLGEFYVTTTRKLARPVASERAQSMVEQMSRLPVVAIDGEHVAAAIAGSRAWQVSYWDALVIAAAASSGCSTILSEDLADGARYANVRVVNPFRSGHRVSESRAGRGDVGFERSWRWAPSGLG